MCSEFCWFINKSEAAAQCVVSQLQLPRHKMREMVNISTWSGILCNGEWDMAQALGCPPVKVWIMLSIVLSDLICNFPYFLFQRPTTGPSKAVCGVCFPYCGKVHIKNKTRVASHKVNYVTAVGFILRNLSEWPFTLTSTCHWYENQCALTYQKVDYMIVVGFV